MTLPCASTSLLCLGGSAHLPTCPPAILPAHLPAAAHLPTCPACPWWWCPACLPVLWWPTRHLGHMTNSAWPFQIRIAFGLAFPPGDLVISRDLWKQLGYYSLCTVSVPGGRSGLLLFFS